MSIRSLQIHFFKVVGFYAIAFVVCMMISGCKNTAKEYMISPELTAAMQRYHQVYEFYDGIFTVSQYKKGKLKFGFIDIKGNEVAPCIYDVAWSFSEGLASVQLNGKWGFIDTKGNGVVPCIYDGAGSFSEGLASVWLNGKSGYIDKLGNSAFPFGKQ